MKAVAYSIKSFEKEFLAIANHKKHDITLISNPLNFDTLTYATDKDVVIVSATDNVSADILKTLAALDVKYMISRSADMDYIDQAVARRYGIRLASAVSDTTPQTRITTEALREIADQTIRKLDLFQITKGADKAKTK